MDTSLIFLIVGFILIAILILKLIKKIVVAIVTIVLVFLLIVGGIFGIIYYDINQLSSTNQLDTQILYQNNGGAFILGVNVPISKGEIVEDKITNIEPKNLLNVDLDKVKKEDNEMIIVIEDSTYKAILDKEYDLADFSYLELSEFADYDLTLSNFEVIEIIEAQDSLDTFAEILLDKNDITGFERNIVKSLLKVGIESALEEHNSTIREGIFLFVLKESLDNKTNIVSLMESFNEDEIEVYPQRLSFKLLKMLPVSAATSFIEDEAEKITGD